MQTNQYIFLINSSYNNKYLIKTMGQYVEEEHI